MRFRQNYWAFRISITFIYVIAMFISGCKGVIDEKASSEKPTVTAAIIVTPKPMPNLAIKEAWFELAPAGECLDPEQPQYAVHVEVVNNGNADSGAFHIQLNKEHEEVISHLDQGESIALEFTIELDQLQVFLDYQEEVIEADETDNIHEVAMDFSSMLVCTPIPEPTPSPQFSVFPLLPAGVAISILQIHMFDESVGWGIGEAEKDIQHILRTVDGGSTWLDVTPPVILSDNKVSFIRATAYFMDPEEAWVTFQSDPHGEPGIVWHTDDAGLTWQSSMKRLPGIIGSASSWPVIDFVGDERGWMMVNHFVGDNNYEAELFLTHDSGQTWEQIQNDQVLPWVMGSVGGIHFLDTSSGVLTSTNPLYAGVYVYWTDNAGRNWVEQKLESPDTNQDLFNLLFCGVSAPRLFPSQECFLSVYCYNEDGLSVPYLYLSTDKGSAWKAYPFPGRYEGTSIEIVAPDLIFILGRKEEEIGDSKFIQKGELYRSVDGGKSWFSVATVDWYGPIHFVDEQVGWALAREQDGINLLHTHDGGLTWHQLQPRTTSEDSWQRSIVSPGGITLPQDLLPITLNNIEKVHSLDNQILAQVFSMVFTPDAKTLILAREDGWIIQWPIRESGYPLAAYRHSEPFIDMDVALEVVSVASASEDGIIKVWFMGSPIQFSVDAGTPDVSALALSPDGSTLVVAMKDGSLELWDLSENLGRKKGSFDGASDEVVDMVFSPDGQQVALATSEGIITIWDPLAGKQIAELKGYAEGVVKIAFSPDTLKLASAFADGNIRIWDLTSSSEELILEGDLFGIQSIAYSPGGEILAAGAEDGNLYLWETEAGTLISVLNGSGASILRVVFSPAGDVIASASEDGLIHFWGTQDPDE